MYPSENSQTEAKANLVSDDLLKALNETREIAASLANNVELKATRICGFCTPPKQVEGQIGKDVVEPDFTKKVHTINKATQEQLSRIQAAVEALNSFI